MMIQLLDPHPFKCACEGSIKDAIKHTKKYCFNNKYAIKLESANG